MANPVSQLRTLRPDLSTFEQLDREMQLRGYIGTRILPAYNVSAAYGTFGVITLKSLLANANANTKRTSTGGYNRGDYEFEDRSYQTKENGWEEPIDERESNLYANYFDMEQMATHRAWEHVLASLENRIQNAVLAATIAAGRTAGVTASWRDYVDADPITDVANAQEAIWARTGVWPTTMAISRRLWRHLRRSERLKDELRSEGAGRSTEQKRITLEMVADVLDLEEIIIANGIKNTANPAGNATIASSFPDDQVLLTKTAKTQDFKEPCIGRTFHWGGDGSQLGDGQMIGVVEQYEEPQTRKQIVRARHETAEFILYGEMAQVLTGAFANPS